MTENEKIGDFLNQELSEEEARESVLDAWDELKAQLTDAEATLEKIADLFRCDTCCPHRYTALEMVSAWRRRKEALASPPKEEIKGYCKEPDCEGH